MKIYRHPENEIVQIFDPEKFEEYRAIINEIMNKEYNIEQGEGITAIDLLDQLLTQITSIHIPNRMSYAPIVEKALPIDVEKQLEIQDYKITDRDFSIIVGAFDVRIDINKDNPEENHMTIITY